MVNLFVTDLKKRVHDSFDKVNRNVKQVVFDEQRKESLLNNMGKSLAPEELEKSSMAKEPALEKAEASSTAKNQLKSSLDGFRVIEIDEPEKGRHR